MKAYAGTRRLGRAEVVVGEVDALGGLVNVRALPPRNDLINHSPDGFEWGYGGSGPSQLALALCADALGDDERAKGIYQHFKWQHVAIFPQAGWRLTDEQIRIECSTLEGAHP